MVLYSLLIVAALNNDVEGEITTTYYRMEIRKITIYSIIAYLNAIIRLY